MTDKGKPAAEKIERLVEVAFDESGEELWREPYVFRRLSAPGEIMVRNGVRYVVMSSKLDGNVITTVVTRR